MINVSRILEVNHFKDISREPKVRNKSDRKEKTHTIALVPPNYVSTLWPDVEVQLSKAVARSKGRWTIPALYQAIIYGHQHLWVAFNSDKQIDGVGTTELVEYPEKRMLCVQFLGGKNFNDWVWDMVDKYSDWARDNNCSGIEATAREGFWKWLQQDGFEKSYVVYEKRIS
tara:strand:- start:19 stop:531 length:513 start_codon:yes stop_codon:yes gene_type:complete